MAFILSNNSGKNKNILLADRQKKTDKLLQIRANVIIPAGKLGTYVQHPVGTNLDSWCSVETDLELHTYEESPGKRVFTVNVPVDQMARVVPITYTLNSGVHEIPDVSFRDINMNKMEIPEGITSIGNQVFSNSTIRTLELPSTMSNFSEETFAYASISIIFLKSSTPPTITRNTFNHSTVTTVMVPEESLNLYKKSLWGESEALYNFKIQGYAPAP